MAAFQIKSEEDSRRVVVKTVSKCRQQANKNEEYRRPSSNKTNSRKRNKIPKNINGCPTPVTKNNDADNIRKS